jgi:hypothetical protein
MRRLLTIDGHARRLDDGFESDLKVAVPGRWIRGGLFYGSAPGSHMMGRHMAFWRTQWGGMHGWNFRFGRWPEPCITMLLHTRPTRQGEPQ